VSWSVAIILILLSPIWLYVAVRMGVVAALKSWLEFQQIKKGITDEKESKEQSQEGTDARPDSQQGPEPGDTGL